MIGEPKKKQSFDDLLKSGSTNGEVKATGKNQTGTRSFDDLLSEDTTKPVEQPFTEAPAQGPQTPQTPQQKFEQAIPAGSSTPSATPLDTSQGTLTDSRGPSVADTPKANYELPPETADISKAKPYGETFSKEEVATAGPGRSEKAKEDRLFLDRFADLDLKGIEKYKGEVLPRQMNVLKQAQAVYNADDKQVGFSEVDLLGLKQQAERDPSLIPVYDQRVKEHNGMVSSLNKQKMAILDLVGAYERDEKLLSMQELLLKREKGSWGGAVWNTILQGEGDVLSGMAGAAANKLLGLESDKNSVLGSLIFPKGFMAKHLGYEPGTTPDEIAKDFRENTLSEMRNVPKEKLGSEGTTDEYIANKSEGFWGSAFLGLARSAPAMATPAMTGIAFQVFDGTMEEMSGPGFEGVSEEEKMDVAVPISLISVALEKFGFRNLSKSTPVVGEIYKRVLAKLPANATATQIENAVNGEVSGWVSNSLGKLAGGAASEFETGFFQEGATMAAKDLYDITAAEDGKGFQLGNSWRDYAKNMFYSGAQEAAGGMMMAAPYAVSAAIKKNEVGKVTSDTQYEFVEELATDPNFRTTFEAQQAKDVEEGRITPEQSEEIKTDFATARKIVEKIPDDLPVTSRREAFDILSQIDKLSKKDADLVGDKVQALRERLKGLQGVPKVEEAKTDAEGKKVEVKPTKPTGNETKERSTLAETKEDGTAKEGANIVREAETTNELREDVLGDLPKDGSGQSVKPNEALETEVPSGPTNATASGVSTDQNAGPGSTLQTEEQPATPEPVSNKPGEGKGTKESPYITRSGKKYGNFEITRDPDTGKNTIKPRSKSKDTWSKLPDKLAAKEYRAHKKRLLQAMRDAEVEFSKSTGHPINPRTGDPIGDGKRKKAERVSYQKEVDRKAGELSTTDKGTFGIALAWLSDGNTKISPESVRAYLGWGAGRNEGANAKYRVTEEEKNSKWILAKEGKGINISALAHKMWEENLVDGETLPGYETTDFEEAIAAVITVYKNADEAYSALDELVRDNSPLDVDEQVRAYYEAQMANVTEEDVTREDIERTDAYIDKLTEDELDKLWEEKNAFEAEAANVGTEQGDTVSVPDQQGSKRAETGKEGKVTAKIKGISTEAQKEIDEALGLSSTDNSGALAQKPTNTRTINTGKLRTDRVVAALKKLVPNLKIVAPKTNNGYAEATKDIGEGLESTWGIYDPRTNKLYLNPSSPDLRQTLFHEAAHPIIIALAKNKPELFSKFYDQVRTEKGGKYTKFGQQYSDLSEAAQMAEALAEFFGDVVSGRVPVSTKPDSLYQQFKDFLKDILAALGWDMRSIDLGKPTDVREFAAQMKKAFDKGIAIEGFAPLTGNKEAKVALQDDADRLVDGWYSRLDQAVAAKGNTQSGADWSKWMEARAKDGSLSMEEVKWTGLAEFLDGKNKVTSQEVRDFLKENRVKVEVVEKGGVVPSESEIQEYLNSPEGEGGTREDAIDYLSDRDNWPQSRSEDTKFSQYQLPGGTSYREVLVTLPNDGPSKQPVIRKVGDGPYPWKIFAGDATDGNHASSWRTEEEARANAMPFASKTTEKFRSSHFDEPNILVHLRVNDRTDADGKKVLFVEEMQSDWGQQGKKEGFRKDDLKLTAKKASGDNRFDVYQGDRLIRPAVFAQNAERALAYIENNPNEYGSNSLKIPTAPFVTDTNSWVELGLKQAIRMAVEGGYDRIAWTNGTQQNERYDLSKQVDSIDVSKDDTGMYKILAKKNGETTATKFAETPQEIEAFIGKDMAEKIVSANIPNGGAKVFSGVDLQLGGSGMKGFYDKILPNVAKKVSKKLGGDGKVGETSIMADKQGWKITPPEQTTKGQWLVKRSDDPLSSGIWADTKEVAEKVLAEQKKKFEQAQQSIEITDAMRDKVGLGVPLMQRKSPKQTASVFHKHGVNNLTARAHMESVGLDPAFIDDVLVELAGLENKKPPVSKSTSNTINKSTGVTKPVNKVTVNDRTALKDQIRLQSRAATGAKKDIRERQKVFSDSVKASLDLLYGKITPKQASSIVTRATKVDPSNHNAIARFIDYADRVIENANYAQSLSEAKSARKKAAKIAANKKVPNNHRDAMLAASKIDVSLIDDPQVYADKVNEYATAMASVKTSRYNQSNTNEFMEFLEPLEKEVDDAYRDIIKEEYGVFDTGELNPKEFLKALEAENIDTAMSELDSKEKRDELTRRIREMADSRASALSSYSNEDISERQSGIIDSLKKANIDRLSLQQQADYIKFADNILVNDAFYGADYMGAIADNSVQIEDALEISAKMPVRNIFSRRLALQGMSQDDMFSFFWSKDVRSAKIQNRIGYGDYIRGKQKWTQQMNDIGQKMTKFYRALSKKYKDSYGEESMTAEGMVAFAIQSMPGLNEEGSFEARKSIIQEDIKAKSNDKKLQKEAVAAGIVFNDLIAESKSIEDLLEKTKKKYPAAYESINFLIDLSKPYKDAIKDNAENTWNQPGNYDDPHYIHTRFKERPGAVIPLDPAAPKSVNSTSLRPKMAKSTLSRQKYHTLAPNRIISYDARHNVFGSISNSLYDVYTSRAQMRMSEFFKMPDAVSVFGSPENISFVNEMVKRFVAAQYLKEDEASKLLSDVVKATRKIATTMALGGFTQIAKQGIEAMTQTTVLLNGRVDKIVKMGPSIGAASELIGKYSIGSRSGIQGATKWDGKVKQHTAALEAAIRNRAWDHVKQHSEGASKLLLYSLTKGDTSVAAMSFMALYEQQRKKQGHRVRDWNTEGELHDGDQQRIDAATWANSMINQFMTSSDSAQMASIAKSGGSGFEKLFKIAAFPFSSFSIQAASKKAVDASTMYAWTKLALQGDSKRNELAVGKAAQSFLAGALSSAAYAMTAVYMVGALKDYLAELLGSFFDDDDEGDKDFVTMASVIQGMYMLGFMDTDINAIVQKEQRTRVKAAKAGVSSDEIRAQRKETQPEFDKKKVLSRYIADVSGISAVPLLSDGGIDFLNYLKYKSLVKEGSESVMKKDGTPMKFTAWQRTTQTPFYRYGQGWNDDNPSGLYGVITQNAKRTAEQIELLQRVTPKDE